MTRLALILPIAAACGGAPSAPGGPDAPAGSAADAPPSAADAAPQSPDASTSVPLPGFGDLSGECGVLSVADLLSPSPSIHRDTFSFATAYVDPDDRAQLTPGGQRMFATPNAGGSSIASEAFAYEELARCELATLLHTETEIVYATQGKITDFEVAIDGHQIGVSVTRGETFPLGGTYTLGAATTLITRKLNDIKVSTADVSAADKWDKQILAIMAYDEATADTVAQAWSMLDANTKGDTIVILTATDGADTWIY
jgi:hypothetical protein